MNANRDNSFGEFNFLGVKDLNDTHYSQLTRNSGEKDYKEYFDINLD
jgi:hypothetical protein